MIDYDDDINDNIIPPKLKINIPNTITNSIPNTKKKNANINKNAIDSNKIYEKITLQSHQTEHVQVLNQILDNFPIACDFSKMGSGKSFTASYIALNSKLSFKHVIVIGPLSIKNDWDKKRTVYGVPIYAFLSYCSLRSVKGKTVLSHDLLERTDVVKPMMYKNSEIDIDIVEFKCTETYKKLVQEGLLLIIDEIQNVKNRSS